jgi:hypothetical protein
VSSFIDRGKSHADGPFPSIRPIVSTSRRHSEKQTGRDPQRSHGHCAAQGTKSFVDWSEWLRPSTPIHQFGTVAAFLIAAGTLLQLLLSENSSWIRFRAALSIKTTHPELVRFR